MASIEYHPVDPYLGGGATAGHAGLHAPLQAHPCVEHVVRVFDSTEHELHGPHSFLQAIFLRTAGRRQRNGHTPDRDRQSARERHNFGMFSVCNHTTAASCPLAGARCRCEATREADQPCMSRRRPPPQVTPIWRTAYAGTPSVLHRRLSSCSPWIIAIGVGCRLRMLSLFRSSSSLRYLQWLVCAKAPAEMPC